MSASQIHTLTVPMKLSKTSSCETLRFEGNKIHCSPRDHSLSYLLYCKTSLLCFVALTVAVFEST